MLIWKVARPSLLRQDRATVVVVIEVIVVASGRSSGSSKSIYTTVVLNLFRSPNH